MFKSKLASGEITEDHHKMAAHEEEPKETAKAETKTEKSKTKSGD